MLFATSDLAELEEAARDGTCRRRVAAKLEPAPPELLAPNDTWRTTISSPGALADGSYVRVSFGPFAPRASRPTGWSRSSSGSWTARTIYRRRTDAVTSRGKVTQPRRSEMDEETTLGDEEIGSKTRSPRSSATLTATTRTRPTVTQTTPTPRTRTRTTRTPASSEALGRAIEPVEPELFLSEHWEQKPLVVPRAEEGRFDDLLSARDVERLITETGLRTPGFRLVKAGATVSDYTTDLSWRPSPFTGVADVPRVLQEFDDGATIVLQGLHHFWLPLARYCRHLEAYRPRGAGERVLHTSRLTGPPCPPRHA